MPSALFSASRALSSMMTGVGVACDLAVVGISGLSDLVTGLAIRFGELEDLIWNMFRGIPTSPWKGQQPPCRNRCPGRSRLHPIWALTEGGQSFVHCFFVCEVCVNA